MSNYPYSNAPELPEGNDLELGPVVFGREQAVELEIGSGRGWFLVERLESKPDVLVVGLEIRRKWAQVVDDRLRKRGWGERGRVFAEDARLVLPRLKAATLAAIFIHFPDPWWKKRHRKRLVITPESVELIARALCPGGELFIQTDVVDRHQTYRKLIAETPALEAWADQAEIAENPHLARSPRERRCMEDGLPIYRLRYRRKTC